MDALTHEFRTQSFIFILWFISKFLVTWCEQLLDLKELPKLKVSDGSHLSVVLSLWCLCFLSLIPVLSFFCILVIKNIRQTGTAFRPRSSRFWSRAFAQRVALMCGALDSLLPITFTGLLWTFEVKSIEVQSVWQLTVLRVKDLHRRKFSKSKLLI